MGPSPVGRHPAPVRPETEQVGMLPPQGSGPRWGVGGGPSPVGRHPAPVRPETEQVGMLPPQGSGHGVGGGGGGGPHRSADTLHTYGRRPSRSGCYRPKDRAPGGGWGWGPLTGRPTPCTRTAGDRAGRDVTAPRIGPPVGGGGGGLWRSPCNPVFLCSSESYGIDLTCKCQVIP